MKDSNLSFIMNIISSYNHDVYSLMNYLDFILYCFDFLLTKMITTNTSIIITISAIDVVIARPIIKPVLELPLVDDVDTKKDFKIKIC